MKERKKERDSETKNHTASTPDTKSDRDNIYKQGRKKQNIMKKTKFAPEHCSK